MKVFGMIANPALASKLGPIFCFPRLFARQVSADALTARNCSRFDVTSALSTLIGELHRQKSIRQEGSEILVSLPLLDTASSGDGKVKVKKLCNVSIV